MEDFLSVCSCAQLPSFLNSTSPQAPGWRGPCVYFVPSSVPDPSSHNRTPRTRRWRPLLTGHRPMVVYTESHWPAKETEARQGRGHTGRKRPSRALTAGSAAPESQLNKYLLKESEGGSWPLVSAVAPCPAGPLILFLEFTRQLSAHPTLAPC